MNNNLLDLTLNCQIRGLWQFYHFELTFDKPLIIKQNAKPACPKAS